MTHKCIIYHSRTLEFMEDAETFERMINAGNQEALEFFSTVIHPKYFSNRDDINLDRDADPRVQSLLVEYKKRCIDARRKRILKYDRDAGVDFVDLSRTKVLANGKYKQDYTSGIIQTGLYTCNSTVDYPF
mmetsp:Transcript_20653/g.31263  ORF Transcript_20653/g.31263 Transcript_20653/m.31263 type:complete len:131 (-) Transcript_20653:21-413(-)